MGGGVNTRRTKRRKSSFLNAKDEPSVKDENEVDENAENTSEIDEAESNLTMESQDFVMKSQVFSGKNYSSWKKLIEVNLRGHGWADTLYPYVPPTNAGEVNKRKAERDLREAKAFAFIYNRLDTTRQIAVNLSLIHI